MRRRPQIRAILFDKDGTLIDCGPCGGPRSGCAGRPPAFADELLRRLGYEPAEDSFEDISAASTPQLADLWSTQPTLADLAMARAAGVGLAVAVLTGGCPAEALAREADLVLANIADLDLALGAWLAVDREASG